MAKPTITKKAKPTKPKKPAAPETATAGVVDDYDPSKARVVLQRVLARWQGIGADERSAFGGLVTDEQRIALGRQTKADSVARDAVSWIVLIDSTLRQYPSAQGYYAPERFVYFTESVLALNDRLGAQQKRRAALTTARGHADARRRDALAVRGRLVSRLLSFAGRRENERAQLAACMGTIRTDDGLGRSLKDLAKLAREWLGRKDKPSTVLQKTSRLTADLASEALAAAKQLTESAASASLEGRDRANDTPAINREEGTVLSEMEEAMRLFADAHREDEVIPSLVPGPGTRHVLGVRKKKAAASDASPEDPPPAPPAS